MAATVKGAQKAIANIRKCGPRGVRAVAASLYVEGLHVIADSVPRTPSVTGRLRNSHFVSLPEGPKSTVNFGFGTEYAYRVHEDIITPMELMSPAQRKAYWAKLHEKGRDFHKKSAVGGPKYLQNGVDETAHGRVSRVASFAHQYFENDQGVTPTGEPKTEAEARKRGLEMQRDE